MVKTVEQLQAELDRASEFERWFTDQFLTRLVPGSFVPRYGETYHGRQIKVELL